MGKALLAAASALVLAVLACSPTIRLPAIETGPTETISFSEPLPDEGMVMDVEVNMGAGSLDLSGGASVLMEADIRFNVPDWRPTVTRTGSRLVLEQRTPRPGITVGEDVVNDWTVRLGDAPMNLSLHAGAYSGRMDLGGLSLNSLTVADGASDTTVQFGSANGVEMDALSYKTGASTVSLIGLGYANFEEMSFEAGAGTYLLDFSGPLERNATVRVRAGVSTVRIEVPSTTRTEVQLGGGLTDVTTIGVWTQSGEDYGNDGQGPTLSIYVDMGLGSLTLVSQ